MRRMDFRFRSLVELASNLTGALVVVSLAIGGFGVWSLVWGMMTMTFISTVAYLPQLRRIPIPVWRLGEASDVICYGLKVSANHLLYLVYSRADIFIIGKMLGERATGYYSMAFHLVMLPLDKVGTLFNRVAFPAFATIQHDLAQTQSIFLQMIRFMMIICLPIIFGLAVVADDAVVIVLTEKWQPIVPILQLMSIFAGLRLGATLMTEVMYGRGKAGNILRFNGLYAICLPLGFLVGVHFGVMGVVAVWLTIYPTIYFFFVRACLEELSISWWRYWNSIQPACAACLVMVVAVRVVHEMGAGFPAINRLMLEVLTGALSYFTYFLFFHRQQIVQVWNQLAQLRGSAQ
jgi:O-antigen/teichoic acid export membrane protein